jgi:hypothetical protein
MQTKRPLTLAGGGGGRAAFGALSKPNRSAVGRESYAGDILANLFHQYEAAIPKAERNKVGLAFLKLLESDIPTDGYAQSYFSTRPMKKAISNGRIRHVPDRDFDKKYDPDDANSPIMAVRRGGKEVLIGIHDRRIASAMKGSTAAPVAAHPIVNGIHAFTRTYANLLTTWNPVFMVGNLPRDIETAIVQFAQQFDMQGDWCSTYCQECRPSDSSKSLITIPTVETQIAIGRNATSSSTMVVVRTYLTRCLLLLKRHRTFARSLMILLLLIRAATEQGLSSYSLGKETPSTYIQCLG